MRIWIFSITALCLLFGWEGLAVAHSTKGRTWVVLKKNLITADDAAYYIEPYVFEKKYKDKYEKSYNRFSVAEFLDVQQKEGTARISFTVLDWITKDKIKDYMLFKRNPDQTWSHIDEQGNVIRSAIRTMQKKSIPLKVWVPAAILILLFLVYQCIKKRFWIGRNV